MVIIDANFTIEEVLSKRQEIPAPKNVLDRQRLIDVTYYSFDGELHQGQVVIDKELVADIQGAFALMRKTKFPVTSAVPYIDRSAMTDSKKNASLNNVSGFNYRYKVNKDKNELSNHSFGRAIDINPLLNPYIKGDVTIPQEAKYDPSIPGTITSDAELVTYFKNRGWEWGGEWIELKDYMHFEKQF